MAIQTKKTATVKILLIEDDEDDFILTRDLLAEIDKDRFHLSWEKNVEGGLSALQNHTYNICFVDYRLGEFTGIELIKKAKEEDVHIPFVMLTGENDHDTDMRAVEVGAYDYLQKATINPSTLEKTIRYVLARNKVEKKLRQAEEKYRTYFENAVEGMFQSSLSGKFINANPALAQILGYSSTNELISSIDDIAHIYVKPTRRIQLISILKKKGVITNAESEVYKKDGTTIWISENIHTIYNSQKKPHYFEGTLQDITFYKHREAERKKLLREQIARKEAEVAQKKLQHLSDASKILASSLNYRETLSNVTNLIIPSVADWCRIDTLKSDGTLQNLILNHKNPIKYQLGLELQSKYPSSPKYANGIYEVIKNRKSIIYPTVTSNMIKKSSVNKEHFDLLMQIGLKSVLIVPIISHQKVLGVISLIRSETATSFTKGDLLFTEELASRAASAIENANLYEQAQEGIRVRDEFLNIASHELKTPLTSLQLQMQLILKIIQTKNITSSQATLENLINSSTKQIRRLAQLINDLLDVSRISNKKLELVLEDVNLTEITQDIIERFEEAIHKSGSTVIFKNADALVGKWDKSRIDQVVTNLLSNAVKYGEGKPISITLDKNDSYAQINITDKGLGMSKEESRKIFEKFERTEAAKKVGGMGLGLYIVKEIIDAHGGNILVKSQKNKGSTFTVTLPFTIPHHTN